MADRPFRDRSCFAPSKPARPHRAGSRTCDAVGQPQHEVRIRRPRPGATDTLLLDRIIRLPNARGVDHRHRIAVEIELHLDDIARGAGVRRHDRDLTARELIHQRRLADIRRSGDRDDETIAKPLAPPLPRQDFLDLGQQRFDLRQRRRDQFRRHVALVRKINSGFDQGRRFDDPRAPIARSVAKQSLQLAQRLAPLPIGVGMDEIVETFGLGQIELAVLESAPGKFAGLGRREHLRMRTAPRTKRPAPHARHGREIPRRLRRSRWPDPETTAPPHRRSAAGRHP